MEWTEFSVCFSDEEAMRVLRLPMDMLDEIRPVIERTRKNARPKAAFAHMSVSNLGGQNVRVGEVITKSAILSVNLKDGGFCVPYICTCGRELEEIAKAETDPAESFMQYELSELVLYKAMRLLRERVSAMYGLEPLYSMTPGSLDDWPLTAQKELFAMLPGAGNEIGVTLMDSMLMLPVKSVSGIFFTGDEEYSNCMLCPREMCPNRSAPYVSDMFDKRYGSQA